jgi:hypothetical protein
MAVAFDAATIGHTGPSATVVSTHTTAHTPVGTPTLVLAWIEVGVDSGNVTATDLSSVTYGGSAMTAVNSSGVQTTSTSARFWLYKLLSPSSGAQNLVVTRTGGNAFCCIIACAETWTGTGADVQNYTTTTSTGATNSPTLAVTSSTGNMVSAGGCHGDTITGVGAGMTSRASDNVINSTAGNNMRVGDAAGAASVNTSFTSAVNDHWVMIGVDVYEAGGAPPPTLVVAPTVIAPPQSYAVNSY